MQVTHQKLIDCSAITLAACSDSILVALQHSADFALRADTGDATIHGSVSIHHNIPPVPHEIIIEVYETDSAPIPGRTTTLARPADFPTEASLIARLA